MKNLYEILEIKETSNKDEIKRAYKKLAIKYHPDKNKDPNATEKFREICTAYETLSDPEKKTHYDKYGDINDDYFSLNQDFNEVNSDTSWFFQDIFNNIFDNDKKNNNNTNFDISITLEIKINQGMEGDIIKKDICVKEICELCHGEGKIYINKCTTCNGTGKIIYEKHFIRIQQICSLCKGVGFKQIQNCNECKNGFNLIKKSIEIKIPVGIQDNEEFVLSLNKKKNITPKYGNINIKINIIKNEILKLINHHLYLDLNINIFDAILGNTIFIPFYKEKIKLVINPYTQTNTISKIKGKGYFYKNSKKRGDLFIKLIIETPNNLNSTQLNLINKLNKFNLDKNNPIKIANIKKLNEIFID